MQAVVSAIPLCKWTPRGRRFTFDFPFQGCSGVFIKWIWLRILSILSLALRRVLMHWMWPIAIWNSSWNTSNGSSFSSRSDGKMFLFVESLKNVKKRSTERLVNCYRVTKVRTERNVTISKWRRWLVHWTCFTLSHLWIESYVERMKWPISKRQPFPFSITTLSIWFVWLFCRFSSSKISPQQWTISSLLPFQLLLFFSFPLERNRARLILIFM